MSTGKDRVVDVVRVLVLALGAATFGLFAYVAVMRFVYPVDAEWMVGAVREAVGRLARGEPMYVAPSEGFIPFVYPPLYHWACSILARFTSTFIACKAVSLGATFTLAWCIWRVARELGASRFWASVGVLVHFSAVSWTLFFYDLERVDAFAAMIVALALVLLVTGEDTPRTLGAGVLLGLAFYAKQPHVLSLGAAAAGLFVAGQRRRAITVAAIGGVVLVAMFAYLEVTTHGWFRFYCVTLPGKHGIDAKVISTFFVVDWPKGFAVAAGSLALAVPLVASLVRRRQVPEGWTWRDVLLASIVLVTMLEAFSLRAHRGGWSNVIIAWTPFGCMAMALVASRLEKAYADTTAARAVSLLLLAAAGFQLLGGIFDPNDAAPDAGDLAERRGLIATVRKLEREGDVVVTTTGEITQKTHFQIAALFDILRSDIPLPKDLAEAIEARRYTAVIVNAPVEFRSFDAKIPACEEAFALFARNYFVAARRFERDRNGMSGFDARPRYIMRPRKKPLVGMTIDQLDERLRLEKGLASTREFVELGEPTIDDTVEERAAAIAEAPR